ncbi:hypothetical protein H2248_003429 [Termitomyces sp. 'cryptogamus']|nr:hypothetical protein H2248_003429 [Termitomyces sp. 'cryptogamus']
MKMGSVMLLKLSEMMVGYQAFSGGFSSRLQRDTSREPRTWASVSPWGLLESSGSSRQTSSGGNDQSDGEGSVFQRIRRHAPRRIPTFMRPDSGAAKGRHLGDNVRDEDWNSDDESLLSLPAQLGEVKPRCTPDNVIDS